MATGLKRVEARIEVAAAAASRSVDEISLVVVTKYASDAGVTAVLADGARLLGESRAGQLVTRSGRFADAEWHFVGHLQRNKVNAVRPRTTLLHSVDRARLAAKWAATDTPPPVLVQVNVGGEPQKSGVAPGEAQALVEHCHELGVEVRGLMTVPPRPERPEDSARWFDLLRRLRDSISLDHPTVTELSMGMSDDFEVAVGEGATILRVGRAIFDPSADES